MDLIERNKSLIGPYAERMVFIPVLGSPKYIEKDDEFVWYEMEVPTIYRDGVDEAELDASVAAVEWLPVHAGLEILREDAEITVFRVPVPINFLRSDLGIIYYQKRQMTKYTDYKLQEGE
jgi:hypothetical protein